MGQRTLVFTKQMLRIFSLVELEEFDFLVAEAWPSIPRSSGTNRNLFASHSEYKQAQTNKHIYIYMRTLHHSDKNIIKHAKWNRVRYYGHTRKKKRDSRSYGREVITFTLNQYVTPRDPQTPQNATKLHN